MAINRETIETKVGNIDYHYSITKEYPEGILIFLGSYVNKEERGKGHWRMMVKELFNMFPEGTRVQAAAKNKHLQKFFTRIGFQPVKRIEHWGMPDNTKNFEGYINKEMLEKLL